MANEIITGDALQVLRKLPSESVQCIVTSPPYYSLRDYGVDGQIGLEKTPAAFVARLVEVFREARRVLRSDGTLWLNIGDTYAGGSRGRDDSGDGGKFAGPRIERKDNAIPGGFKPKDLMMIPARLAIALQDDGWWLRSDIIWHKLTAMPESVEDRPTSAHEHLFLLAKSERYFYDADAIREPLRPKTFTTYGCRNTAGKGNDELGKVKSDNWNSTVPIKKPRLNEDGSPAGANKRNVWPIAAQPYPEAHFATMPPKLVEPCILAGTSPRACEHCGAPWERVTEQGEAVQQSWKPGSQHKIHQGQGRHGKNSVFHTGFTRPPVTVGWQPTCTCENTGSGKCVVLDPFCGAGTVPLVAIKFQRAYLGIELNPQYVELIHKRIAEVQPVLWEVACD